MISTGIKEWKRIAGLDELRGLSILWVMLCHGSVLWKWILSSFGGFGFHGVVLFFVISGYLITRILFETKVNNQYFGRFYINRIFRIWPLMLLAPRSVFHNSERKRISLFSTFAFMTLVSVVMIIPTLRFVE